MRHGCCLRCENAKAKMIFYAQAWLTGSQPLEALPLMLLANLALLISIWHYSRHHHWLWQDSPHTLGFCRPSRSKSNSQFRSYSYLPTTAPVYICPSRPPCRQNFAAPFSPRPAQHYAEPRCKPYGLRQTAFTVEIARCHHRTSYSVQTVCTVTAIAVCPSRESTSALCMARCAVAMLTQSPLVNST